MQSKHELGEKEGHCSCSHSMCLGSITSPSALQPRVVSNTGAKYSLTAAVCELLSCFGKVQLLRDQITWDCCEGSQNHTESTVPQEEVSSCQYHDMKWGTGSKAQ